MTYHLKVNVILCKPSSMLQFHALFRGYLGIPRGYLGLDQVSCNPHCTLKYIYIYNIYIFYSSINVTFCECDIVNQALHYLVG